MRKEFRDKNIFFLIHGVSEMIKKEQKLVSRKKTTYKLANKLLSGVQDKLITSDVKRYLRSFLKEHKDGY